MNFVLSILAKSCFRGVNTEIDLGVPLLRTTDGQKCFSFRRAKLWNDQDGKSKLTIYLYKQYMYNTVALPYINN